MADFNLVVGAEISSSTQQFKSDIRSIVNELNREGIKIDIDLGINKKQINSLKKEITEIANSLNTVTGGVSVNSKITKDSSAGIKKISSAGADATKNVEALATALSRIKNISNGGISSNITAEANATANALKKESTALAGLNRVFNEAKRQVGYTKAKNSTLSSSAYASSASIYSEVQELSNIYTLDGAAGKRTQSQVDEVIAKTKAWTETLSANKRTMEENGDAVKSWSDRFGGLGKKFASWFSVSQIIMAAIRAVRQMVQASVELDSAFAQLKIVTGATDEEMERFADTTFKLSKRLGQSATDVAKSIETFSRLGYGLQDASSLAEYATVLANTAAVSTEDATTGLTSIIKGYGMDVTNAEHVADVLIEVGQKYAVSAGEMMEAYQRSGAALNAANTDFEKSAGLIAAANASVQDASIVGKVMPSITVM